MLLKRIVVSLIAIPLLYLCLTELPPVYFLALMVLVSALAQYEFHAMYKTPRIISALGIAGGIALLTSFYFTAPPDIRAYPLMALIISILCITSARLFSSKDPASALKDITPAVVGIIYIPLLAAPMWLLRLAGYEWIILLLVSVWTADTFAFFIGSKFGKRRLYREISPNKTVAGAVGSVAGGVIASVITGILLIKDLGLPGLILIGTALGSVTIVGDLVESMFKRDAGIKDSGSLIPGHGGVLDRIDSILFAAPTLYILRNLL
jgi:phosphatidate cytidylyltransferase